MSRLHVDILSTTLESIANLLLLRSNWDPLDLHSHLNYYSLHIPFSYSYLFFYSYSVLPSVQNPHKYNNSYYFYSHSWHMGSFEQILPSVKGALLLSLSSLLLLLEQALLSPIEKAFPASSATLVVMLVIPVAPYYSVLGFVIPSPIALSSFFLPSCFLSNVYLIPTSSCCPFELLHKFLYCSPFLLQFS